MSSPFKALAATSPGAPLAPFEYTPGPLRPDEVEIRVSYCGICHSDLSMLNNDWGISTYPLVPGHEIVGTVTAAGESVRGIKPGDLAGVGWFAGSCLHCPQCLSGNHHLCGRAAQTIVGRHGGFADRVRANWEWAVPLPAGLDPAKAGPLFCGGITVFSPILSCGVTPTDRAGVVGIGGLGHLALKFLRAWGCEVIAFTSTPSKKEEALLLGAHLAVSISDKHELAPLGGSLDFLLVTSNVTLDWPGLLSLLSPKGRLHIVGAVLNPMAIPAFSLISGQKSVSGSPLGSPATVAKMLAFCVRHKIEPVTRQFPMSRANDALEILRAGKARYRLVLENDLC